MQPLFRIAARVLAASLLCGAAHAQMFRAYLASYGADTNPCTVAAPCRLLPAALGAVSSGGQVWILDSANYNSGPVTISKDVTILAVPGVVGSLVAVAGGPALISTSNNVRLRNLVIGSNAASPGTDGIQVSGGTLYVEACEFTPPLAGAGIRLTAGAVSVHNSVFRDSAIGIYVSGNSSLNVSTSHFAGMTYGIRADDQQASTQATAQVSDSVFMQLFGAVYASATSATSAGSVSVAVNRIRVSESSFGVFTNSGAAGLASASVAGSVFSHIGNVALQQSGNSTLQSRGDNQVLGNFHDTAGTITSAPGI